MSTANLLTFALCTEMIGVAGAIVDDLHVLGIELVSKALLDQPFPV